MEYEYASEIGVARPHRALKIFSYLQLGLKVPWGRFVAPIIVILSSEEVAAPSNWTKNSVCSLRNESELESLREVKSESISSINIMVG